MTYEFLSNEIHQENFGDFERCESKWTEKDEKEINELLKNRTGLFEKVDLKTTIDMLNDGKVISLKIGFIRLKNDMEKCKLCGSELGMPAVSRRNNKTQICSDCGLKEAVEDINHSRNIENECEEKKLPPICYHEDILRPGNIIIIKRDVMGYYESKLEGNYMDFNKEIGVDKYTAEAMRNGSMFGWDTPGANPEFLKETMKL